MAITPKKLFDFASAFARSAEKEGHGTVYPTFRVVAKRFRATHDQIEQACADFDQTEGSYMRPAVGVQRNGAIGAHASRGEWQVEAFRESSPTV